MLDSGAMSHMFRYCSLFIPESEVELNYLITSAKLSADMQANLKGDILVQNEFGFYVIKNAVFVPDLKVNLLSLSALHNNNCNVSFGTELLLINQKNGELIACANALENGLNIISFKVKCPSSDSYAFVGAVGDFLWHRRFGHICGDALNKAVGITDSKKFTVSTCDICAAAKQTRNSCSEM